MTRRFERASACIAFSCLAALSACAIRDAAPADSVAAAWQQRDESAPAGAGHHRQRSPDDREVIRRFDENAETIIAAVDGQPIPHRRVIDLLVKARGLSVLEELIGLETAVRASSERGLTVTQADVDREYERALRNLSDPLSSVTPNPFNREAAERLLDQVLTQRGMSREEFDIITRRNAHLRKVIESEQKFTEAQLRREFDRVYGERVQVRHIQLATLGEVERIKERLANGEDFAELAARYSANTTSAASQGLLDPFSARDEDVPAVFREVAFSLRPGEVSSAVRVGEWYHLLTLEKRLPREARDFAGLRGELERSLRKRVTEPAIFELFEKLFREATIEIYDPDLAKAFHKRYSDRLETPPGRGIEGKTGG